MEGLREIMLKGAFYYRKAIKQPGMLEKYGRGTPNDCSSATCSRASASLASFLMLAIDVYLSACSSTGRLGRSDDLDPALGRGRHQRHRTTHSATGTSR
jgi:hypothetical protein